MKDLFGLADLFPKKPKKKSDFSDNVAKLDEIASKADYKSHIPGSQAWKEIWKAHPELQDKMIEFAKHHPASYPTDYLFCIKKDARIHWKLCAQSECYCEKGELTVKYRKDYYANL